MSLEMDFVKAQSFSFAITVCFPVDNTTGPHRFFPTTYLWAYKENFNYIDISGAYVARYATVNIFNK